MAFKFVGPDQITPRHYDIAKHLKPLLVGETHIFMPWEYYKLSALKVVVTSYGVRHGKSFTVSKSWNNEASVTRTL